VTLTVTAAAVPMMPANPTSISFTAPASNATPYSQTVLLTSDTGPAVFTVVLPPAALPAWLPVSPMSGTTPATLTVTGPRGDVTDLLTS
jgi:hypothetical protein